MNKLEMRLEIAKLEGYETLISTRQEVTAFNDGNTNFDYNPIDDLALNCMLRDKYEIEINYSDCTAICYCNKSLGVTCVIADNTSEINSAVIECILKANNLWTGD